MHWAPTTANVQIRFYPKDYQPQALLFLPIKGKKKGKKKKEKEKRIHAYWGCLVAVPLGGIMCLWGWWTTPTISLEEKKYKRFMKTQPDSDHKSETILMYIKSLWISRDTSFKSFIYKSRPPIATWSF